MIYVVITAVTATTLCTIAVIIVSTSVACRYRRGASGLWNWNCAGTRYLGATVQDTWGQEYKIPGVNSTRYLWATVPGVNSTRYLGARVQDTWGQEYNTPDSNITRYLEEALQDTKVQYT